MDIRFSALRAFDIRTGPGAPVAVFFRRADVVVGSRLSDRTEKVRPLHDRLEHTPRRYRTVQLPLRDSGRGYLEEAGNRCIGVLPERVTDLPLGKG